MDTRFSKKQALLALAFIIAGLGAGSAFSQSAEYRRGYDQGYRDGIEAANAQAQAGRGAGRIIIRDASYGTRDASCDARDAIQQIAGWRRHLEVRASNDLCGDPAPRRPKRLVIAYTCGDGPEQRVFGREGNVLAISCR